MRKSNEPPFCTETIQPEEIRGMAFPLDHVNKFCVYLADGYVMQENGFIVLRRHRAIPDGIAIKLLKKLTND